MQAKFFKVLSVCAFMFFQFPINATCCHRGDKWEKEEILYDDFQDGGVSYSQKWFSPFYGIAGETYFQDGGNLLLSFPKGRIKVFCPLFSWASNQLFYDHLKYFAMSTRAFAIPQRGSIEFSANIKCQTLNTIPDLTMIANKVSTGAEVRYKLEVGRQAGATLHMLNLSETGVLFDWLISGRKAYPIYERLFDAPLDPANIATAFTQIFDSFDISPKMHNFGIRYTRDIASGEDKVDYLIDGKIKATIHNIGIPLPLSGSNAVYPAQGPGERLINELTEFSIGQGVVSVVDLFPFGQDDIHGDTVTIPLRGPVVDLNSSEPKVNSRLWGQGAIGEFTNFKVIIKTLKD